MQWLHCFELSMLAMLALWALGAESRIYYLQHRIHCLDPEEECEEDE